MSRRDPGQRRPNHADYDVLAAEVLALRAAKHADGGA